MRALLDAPAGSSNHASNLLQLPNGNLLCAWFSGTREGASGVAIFVARLPAGTDRWSQPVVVSRESSRSAQNPVLFCDAERGRLTLLHTSQIALAGQGTSEVRRLVSLDQGESWSPPETLFPPGNGPFVRSPPLRSADGASRMLPMYYTPEGFSHYESHYSALRYSEDGAAWSDDSEMPGTRGRLVQPSIVRLASGRLVAFLRSRLADAVYRSTSSDDGASWGAPAATALPNNNASVQAVALGGNALVLAFNNRRGRGARWPLSLALSEDGGESFRWVRDLETAAAEYSYPSILYTSRTDELHVSYTFRRETIAYTRLPVEWIKKGSPSVGDYVTSA